MVTVGPGDRAKDMMARLVEEGISRPPKMDWGGAGSCNAVSKARQTLTRARSFANEGKKMEAMEAAKQMVVLLAEEPVTNANIEVDLLRQGKSNVNMVQPCFGLSNCDFTATFIYVEIQIMRPASAGLSGALAWMEALVKANARSPDLGRDLHQVLTTIL